ncbi:hypothetical protein ACFQL1_22360 [Halomicroarcula sp. GCM10025709]
MSSGYQRRVSAVVNVDLDRVRVSKLLYALAGSRSPRWRSSLTGSTR